MTAGRWHVTGIALLLTAPGHVVADPVQPVSAEAATQLRAAVNADELDVAALAARLGDDPVLTSLTEGDTALRLAALRTTPYLVNKELALLPLVSLARGRDPDLAPAAARRVLAIAQALALEETSVRELPRADLENLRRDLSSLANSSARRDVRVCAGSAAQLLSTLPVTSFVASH